MAAFKNGKKTGALAWAAWSYHNSIAHDEPWSNVEVSVVGFLKLVNDFANYVTKTQEHIAALPVISRASWVPLGEG